MSENIKASKIYKNLSDIPLVFSPEILCDVLGVSKNTAYEIIRSNSFPKKKIGHKIFIYKESFIKWLEIGSIL